MSPHRRPSGVLSLYRTAAQPRPPASVEASILAAARAAQPVAERRQLVFVGAMAATVLVAFTARWLITDVPPAHGYEYGLTEGQAHDYLLEFDPLTTGPGSQEGSP